ncbi:MAG: sulfotransferase domain-containing protein [Nostoc sp. NMS8]|nr:sulfotransferase domain-containing protein [Nostoc sp. NMS8]
MAVFPREQFLILRSEDLYNQTDKTMKQVYSFLEITDYSLSGYPKLILVLIQKLTTNYAKNYLIFYNRAIRS